MKLFSFSRNQCLFLGLTVIILAMFCLYNKNIEGFISADSDTIHTYVSHTGNFVDDVATALKNGVNTWKGLTVDSNTTTVAQPSSTTADTITITKRPDVSAIIGDNCSTQSLLSSEYESDICSDYIGDYQTIDKKCKLLSNTNCSLTNCCVLLNGNKCVAGNVNGPTYLTDQGNQIDFNYYMYRGKTYPENYNPTPSDGYIKKCSKYASSSANISKSCIVQLFNDAGCSNTSPDALINDNTVSDYSTFSLRDIKIDIQNAVTLLKNQIKSGNGDSKILCNGKDSNNPCDNFVNNDKGVSYKCMIKMFNDAGCPNKSPSFIDDTFVKDNSSLTKKNLNFNINASTGLIKSSADNDPPGSDTQMQNASLCYGTPINNENYKNNDKNYDENN